MLSVDVARLGHIAALCLAAGCSETTPPSPAVELEARRGHVMVYDEARRQLILFGGYGAEGGSAAGDRGSTWSWNGTTWTRIATTGPSPRHNAVAVYDAARERVVLFGGIVGQFPNEQTLNDTWEWNGTTWTRTAQTGPSARVHLSMGYDRVRQRTILYGGFVPPNSELRDLWEWNGTAWTQSSVTGPASTVARGAAHDEKAGAFLLFSATDAPAMLMDRYDGATLTRLTPTAPNCQLTLASLGPARGGLISASACANNVFQTSLWSGTAWSGVSGIQPPARASHSIAYDRDRDRVVLFGGEKLSDGTLLSDTWEFNGTVWTQIAGPMLSVGGAYATVVSLTSSNCSGITVQNNPTSVTHTPGSGTLQLGHAGQSYDGTVQASGAFSTTPKAVDAGSSTHTITIAGTFTTTGFTADASVSVTGGETCQYVVRWVGTRQSGTNTIP